MDADETARSVSADNQAVVEEHVPGATLEQLDRLLERRLWNSVMVLVAVLTPVSILRTLNTGWLPIYTVHLVAGVTMLAIHLARRRISRRTLSVIALAYLEAMGVLGLCMFGLMSFGFLWLLACSFLVGAVFGYRVGLVVVVANLVLIVAVMILFMQGQLTLPVSTSVYMKTPMAWVLALLMMAVTPLMLLNTLVLHKQAKHRLIRRVEQQRQEIERLAMRDALTGLVTKRLAQDRLNTALLHAGRNGERAAVLFIDLDGFKRINDQFGHAAGDAVLRAVATELQAAIRTCDTVARIGGDEFLVVLEDLESGEFAGMVAQRMLTGICKPIIHGRHQLQVGASIGVALFPDHGLDAAALQKAADAAMYGVKTSGKNAVSYASTGTETGAWTRPRIGEMQ